LLRASVQEESALSSLEKLSDCLAVFVDSIFVLRSRSGIIGCQGWFEVRITFFFHNLPVFQLLRSNYFSQYSNTSYCYSTGDTRYVYSSSASAS
jgi:hypothetical protein